MVAEIERSFPAGTRLARPRGGYFLWLELPPGADALAIHRQALAQAMGLGNEQQVLMCQTLGRPLVVPGG